MPHNYSEQLLRGLGGTPVRSVRRAKAFMRANLTRPILVEGIAQAAGCPACARTEAFSRYAGRTVTAALHELRLEAVRAALAQGDPALTVGAVAVRFGFSNPGRFAALYRARFGEAPLRTRSGQRAL